MNIFLTIYIRIYYKISGFPGGGGGGGGGRLLDSTSNFRQEYQNRTQNGHWNGKSLTRFRNRITSLLDST